MEFTAEQLRLIRAACMTALPHKTPEEFYEPWKGTYEVATAKLIELGEEV